MMWPYTVQLAQIKQTHQRPFMEEDHQIEDRMKEEIPQVEDFQAEDFQAEDFQVEDFQAETLQTPQVPMYRTYSQRQIREAVNWWAIHQTYSQEIVRNQNNS
jgi:hypothetical protein